MELFEFESKTSKALKLLARLSEKYSVNIDGRKLSEIAILAQRKVRYLQEHNLDSPTSVTWLQESLMLQTTKLCASLVESNLLVIDQDTGTISTKTNQLFHRDATNTHRPSGQSTIITPMRESTMAKQQLSKLFESEIEKAQIVMAVRNDIVDKLQRDAEKMGNMKVDILGPIVDRIKAEHGIEPAAAFRETVGTLLDQALSVLMDVQDKISTETLKLTGDVSSAPTMDADFELDAAVDDLGGIPEFDMGGEESFTEELPMEPLPAERTIKESFTRLGVELESNVGTRGNIFFESKAEMKQWLGENRHLIKKVYKIIKE